MEYFDSPEHLSDYIKANYSKKEIETLSKYFLESPEEYTKGTFLSRINLISRKVAYDVVAKGGRIYLASVELDQRKFKNLMHFKRNEIASHQKNSRISLETIRDSDDGENHEMIFEETFGDISGKYLIDAFIIDMDTAKILIDHILKK